MTAVGAAAAIPRGEAFVVAASSLGTLFEWYDFFLYGALASNIAAHFFAGADERAAFGFALAAFAAGALVRPFGALIFGRIGDRVGRKNTFLATMAIMGLATFCVGLLPDRAQIGIAAPVLLITLRLLQGLALGGEYGGAAIYVAEHAPAGKRGLLTSWINATATLGLLLSLVVILGVRASLSPEAFRAWGWRIPFLASAALLGVSLWIRLQLGESPVFVRMKAKAAISRAPFAEAFGRWSNLKLVLVALVAGAGGTTIWYAGQFYTLFFLERVLALEAARANALVAVALFVSAPSYLLFGWLSDRVGRRRVLLAALALGALALFPLFRLLTFAANPALARAQRAAPVIVYAEPADCSFQLDPLGRGRFDRRSCDIAKTFLAGAGIGYASRALPEDRAAEVRIGGAVVRAPDPRTLGADARAAAIAAFREEARAALRAAGYPSRADPAAVNEPLVVAAVALLVVLGAMYYAPLAALLVELFPARIRYTSLSLPYHIATGWFGGFLPAIAFAIVAATGDVYAGLWYPVGVASAAFLIAWFALPETSGREIEG